MYCGVIGISLKMKRKVKRFYEKAPFSQDKTDHTINIPGFWFWQKQRCLKNLLH